MGIKDTRGSPWGLSPKFSRRAVWAGQAEMSDDKTMTLSRQSRRFRRAVENADHSTLPHLIPCQETQCWIPNPLPLVGEEYIGQNWHGCMCEELFSVCLFCLGQFWRR